MTISNETRVIDLTVGELENIFQKFAEKTPEQSIATYSQPMTTEQLSEFLGGMPLPTIYYKVSKGVMPHIKEGGKLYFIREQIVEWLKSNQRSSVNDAAEQKFQQFKEKLIAKK